MPAGNLAICFGYVLSATTPLIHNIRPFLFLFLQWKYKFNNLKQNKKTDVIFFSSSPTLMGSPAGNDIIEQKLQARVIETILLNTYQIFDDD